MIKVMRLKRTGIKKKGFLIYFVSLVFFLPATQAWSAAEWSEYSRDQEGNVYSYKINQSRGKHIVQAWDQKTFSGEGRRKHLEEMAKNGFSTAGYENLSTVKVLVEFDCKKKMSKGLSVNMFDSANKALYSMYYDKPEWTYILADSLWETLRKEVCR